MSRDFLIREYGRLSTFFEDKFRRRGWNIKASICEMADSSARRMMIDCAENEGPIKIGTMVKFVGDAPDTGATYEQPVLKTCRVTWETPESITPCGSEMIWNYFQFVIDAVPRHKISNEETMSKYFQFVINGAPKNNKTIAHGQVVCNYFQCIRNELKGAKERFLSLADSICVQWYDKDWRPICIGLHEAQNLAAFPDDGTNTGWQESVARMKKKDDEDAEKLERGEWPWPNRPCPWINYYYKLVPISDEERANLLANGLTPEKDPEAFEPSKRLLNESAEAIVQDFKLRHGRPPNGIFPCIPEDSEADSSVVENRYPIEVYDGTFIGDWVKMATKDNYIPPEFFAESLKTFIGAIGGHRIVDEEAPSQENRFYTVLLSEEGGIGKSTAIQWTEELLSFTGLLQRSGEPSRKHIGAVCDAFASGRAMMEAFERQPRVIQVYDELATFVDSLSVSGAGQSLLGIVNTLYDSNIPPVAKIKGMKDRAPSAPKDCHNSILACSITDKWNAMFAGSSAENSGFFQRLNIIASDETRTVTKLKEPVGMMAEFGLRIFKKIETLEHQKAMVRDTPEAAALFEEWYEQHKQDTKEDSADIRNRLQVLVQRNKNILAWALDDWTVDDLNLKSAHPQTRVIEVTADVMERAIKLSKYQLMARRKNQPVIGDSPWVACENHIRKVLKNGKAMTRGALYKKIHVERYGIKVFESSLKNLQSERMISITSAGRTKRSELIEWIGG